MAIVTFPISLGGNGASYSDDADPITGLAGGGHRLRFVPALGQTIIMAQTAVDAAAEASQALDDFDDRFLGPKAADPIVDNDGGALQLGALYFRTTAPQEMRVYTSSGWQGVGSYTTGSVVITGSLKAGTTEINFEPKGTIAGPAALLLDVDQYDAFTLTYSGAITFSFSTTSPNVKIFTLELNTLTSTSEIWPANVKWAGGNQPNISNGTTTLLQFYSSNAGVDWIGSVLTLNAS